MYLLKIYYLTKIIINNSHGYNYRIKLWQKQEYNTTFYIIKVVKRSKINTNHNETITIPKSFPSCRAHRRYLVLAMDSNNGSRGFTNWATTNMWLNGISINGHHGYILRRWQPIAVVVPWCKVATLEYVTKQIGHGGEMKKTRTRLSQVLSVRLAVSYI